MEKKQGQDEIKGVQTEQDKENQSTESKQPILMAKAPCGLVFEAQDKAFHITGSDAQEVLLLLNELLKTNFVSNILNDGEK